MPTKKVRASKLETASTRRKLPIAKRPIYVKLAPNIFLGYRRNEGPGTWNVRVTGPGIDWIKRIGLADDHEGADGRAVLSFWQAQETARRLARRQPDDVLTFRLELCGAGGHRESGRGLDFLNALGK